VEGSVVVGGCAKELWSPETGRLAIRTQHLAGKSRSYHRLNAEC
jgi:hypothetical protein